MDVPENIVLTEHGSLQYAVEHYDFYYVNAGVDFGNPLCECADRAACDRCGGTGLSDVVLNAQPYAGPVIMPVDAVMYLMDLGVVAHRHLIWGMRATGHVKASRLASDFAVVDQAIEASDPWSAAPNWAETVPDKVIVQKQKVAKLACLGLWARVNSSQWVVRRSTCYTDTGPFHVKTFGRDGLPHCKTEVRMVDNRSYYPLALIFLGWSRYGSTRRSASCAPSRSSKSRRALWTASTSATPARRT
jgi:hypothetical protein